MTLKDNIRRILKEEGELINVRRNIGEFPKYVRSTYSWLNAKAFHDFDDYLERVIFSSVRDFIAEFRPCRNMDLNSDECFKTIDKVNSVLTDIILKEYYDEIFEYYIKERNK